MWLLPCVSSHVGGEVAGKGKGGTAFFTHVRFLFTVHAHVPVESALLSKPLSTLGAQVRLLPGVGALVCAEVCSARESLITSRAFEGFVVLAVG